MVPVVDICLTAVLYLEGYLANFADTLHRLKGSGDSAYYWWKMNRAMSRGDSRWQSAKVAVNSLRLAFK